MNEHHEHFIPDDATVQAHLDDEGPVTLIGVQKAFMHAINHRHLLFVVYNDQLRLVEPCCVGLGDQGQLLARCYQRDDGEAGSWKFFRGDKVQGVWEINVPFSVRPEFRSGDTAIATILADLLIEKA